MSSPRQQLEEWLEGREWSLEQAARAFKTNKCKLFRVLRKGQDPDLDLAFAVEDKAGIPARAWLAQQAAQASQVAGAHG